MITPRRRRGFEHLDDPGTSAALRERSLRDVRLANVLLGGTNAVLSELRRIMPGMGVDFSLLDVGTGLADIPIRARQLAESKAVRMTTFSVDQAECLARSAAQVLDGSTCGDARCLPFADASVDVVICSQVLHHFEDAELEVVLAELHRVARRAVIVSDLRRSWFAAVGFWFVAWPMGFHAVTRHDGATSVLRGFTGGELAAHVRRSTGRAALVRRHLGFRLTATWNPNA
ncbi:MAG: methyltransferase domain-containing protein [Gemmatimonadaceae bacterium]